MKRLYFLFFLFFIQSVTAQEELTFIEFIESVRQYHPEINQSKLLERKSDAYMRKARGSLDPVLSSSYDSKSFDEKNYYDLWNTGLKIPTALGVDMEVSYETNRGQFLNEQAFLPENGLLSAGISVPLLRGLFYNDRRFQLDGATLIGKQNEIKRIEMVNKVMFKSIKAYLAWEYRYAVSQAYGEVVDIAAIRLDNTIQLFNQGDKAAIDTIESQQNLINNQVNYEQARLDYLSAFQSLRNHIWGETPQALIDGELYIPQGASEWLRKDEMISSMDEIVVDALPALRRINLDSESLELRKRNAAENIKPQLDLKVNPLLRLDNNDQLLAYSRQDYKLGVNLYFPLLARKARGEKQLIEVELSENALYRDNVSRQISTQVDALELELSRLQDMLSLTEENLALSSRLLEAENERFRIGESSIFLINSREQKVLSNRLKLLQLNYKIRVIIIEWYYLARRLEHYIW